MDPIQVQKGAGQNFVDSMKKLVAPQAGRESTRQLNLRGVFDLVLGTKRDAPPGATAELTALLGKRSIVDNRIYDPLTAALTKLRLTAPMGERGLNLRGDPGLAAPLAKSPLSQNLRLTSHPESVKEAERRDPVVRDAERAREQQAILQPAQHGVQQQAHVTRSLREVPVFDGQGRILTSAMHRSVQHRIFAWIGNVLELVLIGVLFSVLVLPLLIAGKSPVKALELAKRRGRGGAGMASR